jgi:hypothetical protein
MPESDTPGVDRKSAQVIEYTADSGAPLRKRVRNHMKTQGLRGCNKKQRSCDCGVHGHIDSTLRIRGIRGDISIPNCPAGRSARQQRGASGAGFGVDKGGSGVHGAR